MPSGWIGLITRAINSRRKPLKKAASFRVAGGLSWDPMLPGVAALPERSVVLCSGRSAILFLCRLFPGRGILHATYRHARATVDIDYVYLVAFREKQVLVVQVLRSIDRTFGARTEQVTFGEIPGHQRSDVFPARIACPCIGEEGAAEFTVHGDKRFQIRPGRKVPSFRTNALHALDIAEVIRSNRFPLRP